MVSNKKIADAVFLFFGSAAFHIQKVFDLI